MMDSKAHISMTLFSIWVPVIASFSCGHLAAAEHASGRRPRARAFDLLIAAAAHAHGSDRARNTMDLRGFEGLV